MAKEIKYKIKLDGEIGDLQHKLATLKEGLSKLTQNGENTELTKIFNTLSRKIDSIQDKIKTPATGKGIFTSLQKDIASVDTQCANLIQQLGEVAQASRKAQIKLLAPETQHEIKLAEQALAAYQKTTEDAAKESKKLTSAQAELLAVQKRQRELQDKLKTAKETRKAAEASRKEAGTKIGALAGTTNLDVAQSKLKALSKEAEEAAKKLAQVEAIYQANNRGTTKPKPFTDAEGVTYDLKAVRTEVAALTERKEALTAAIKAYQDANSVINRQNRTIISSEQNLRGLNVTLKANEDNVKNAKVEWERLSRTQVDEAFQKLSATLKSVGVDMEGLTSNTSIDELKQHIEAFITEALVPLTQATQQSTDATEDMRIANEKAGETAGKEADNFEKENEAIKNTDAIKSRIGAFVGLNGIMQLIQRTMRQAFQTVKELDAQMTQMAVVTNFEVGDFWKQLPEYTQRANDLGMSIKSVYEAATLYYQQGLDTNQVTAVANETLKMARIAGLDAADATNKMTAALRGFNMEVNEVNARNVADVYSQLAAITASDVEEISTAMTKTASLAHNAGMEFETTAAFLSQIIETTRESAETAGTALKTVIARFQELKKSPSEISEIDGEEVDANKIETALKTVGVALRDTSGQFRQLDEVFLELASKWDSLDTNTQRYIATIAAGSRQQSRFIAMMSNYARTQELVEAANTAAGASARQYAKTQESLESILSRLTNQWNQFVLSIESSDVIKGAIKLFTQFLDAVNKLDKAFGKFSGIPKFALAFAGLKTAGKVLDQFSLNVQNKMGIVSSAVSALGKPFTDLRDKISNFVANKALLPKLVEQSRDLVQASNLGELVDSWNAYGRAVGASEQQMEAFALAIGEEVSLDRAALVLQDEKIAKAYAEAAANNEDAASILLNANMQEIENKGTIKGIALKAKDILTILFCSKQKRIEAYARLFNCTATEAEAVAQGKLNAVLLACPIGWILAAVTALTVAIVLLVKLLPTAENQLKKASAAAELAADGAEHAASAYKDLKDSLTDLSDKVSTIEAMRQGTTEWNAAVLENNQAVLDLINKYSELGEVMQVGADGVLRLTGVTSTGKTADDILAMYETQAQLASVSSIAAEINKLTREIIASNDKTTIRNNTKQIAALEQSYAANVLSQIDSNEFTQDARNAMAAMLSGNYMSEVIATAWRTFDTASKEYARDIEDYINSIGGQVKRINKNTGKVIYYDENNERQVLDAVSAGRQAAARQGVRQAKKAAESLPAILSQLTASSDETNRALASMLSGSEGANLTQKELKQLASINYTELWQRREELGLDELFGNEIEFSDYFNRAVKAATADFEAAEKNLHSITLTDLPTDLSSTLTRGLTEHLSTIYASSGQLAEQQMAASIKNILTGLTKEEADIFVSALNALDWSDIDAIKNFDQTLQELGVTISKTRMDDFTTELEEVSHAIYKIDLEKFAQSLSNLTQLIQELTSGNVSRTWTEEQKNTAISIGAAEAKDFEITSSGNYKYIGDSVWSLINALIEVGVKKAEEIMQQTIQKQQIQTFATEIAEEMGLDWETRGSWSASQRANMISQLQKRSREAGIDLSVAGVNGLTNDSHAVDQTRTRIAELYRNLYGSTLEEDIEEAGQALTIAAEGLDSVTNSLKASEYRSLREEGYSKEAERYMESIDSQAQALGMDKASIENYRKLINAWKSGDTSQMKAMDLFEQRVVNQMNIKTMSERFEALGTSLNELMEDYLNTSDAAKQLTLVQEMVGKFGVNAAEETRVAYAKLVYQMLQGNDEAYRELMEAGAQQMELTEEEYLSILNTAYDKMTVMQQQYTDAMVQLGAGRFEERDGQKFFLFNSAEALDDLANKLGNNKAWENPYEWLYDMNERINAQIRERERLERQYQKATVSSTSTVSDLVAMSTQELNVLKGQADLEETKALGATAEIQKLLDANKKFAQYIGFDNETGAITIDYEAADSITNEAFGEELEAVIGRVETLRDEIEAARGNLNDIEDQIEEIGERGKEEFLELEKSVKDALLHHYEREIDTLEQIDDSINDANSKLLDNLQKNIDQLRQDRTNEKAETDIANKQRRLAYLSMDTSGANASTILSLQREIEEAQEAHTDSLVDQTIQQLQDDNAKAEEQRAEQIEIMRSQLAYADETGQLWKKVEELMETGLGEHGIVKGEELETLLKEDATWTSMSKAQKAEWEKELNTNGKLAQVYTQGTVNALASEKATAVQSISKGVSTQLVEAGVINPTTIKGFDSKLKHMDELIASFKTSYEKINNLSGSDTTAWDIEGTGTNPSKWQRGLQELIDRFKVTNWKNLMQLAEQNIVGADADEYRQWAAKNKASLQQSLHYYTDNPGTSYSYHTDSGGNIVINFPNGLTSTVTNQDDIADAIKAFETSMLEVARTSGVPTSAG